MVTPVFSWDSSVQKAILCVYDSVTGLPKYMDESGALGTVDVTDRAGRLLGVVYGSQGQKIQQKATTFETIVDVAAQSLTALKVSPTGAANLVTNPFFVTPGNGTANAAIDAANTARSTATIVQATQVVDASGKVPPAGEAVGNAPFHKVTDGTNTLDILVQDSAFGTAAKGLGVFGKYQVTPTTYSDGDATPVLTDANGRVALPTGAATDTNQALQPRAATTVTLYNVTMTNADTEYSQALPANTRILEFREQSTGFVTRYAFAAGKVAAPTAPYRTLDVGEVKTLDNLNLAAVTLYFACSTAGKVMEIEAWS